MNKQATPRKDLARGASVARKLLANTSIAQHVLDATIALKPSEVAKGPVQFRRATKGFIVGHISILEGQFFYFVQSKFGNRFYVVIENFRESRHEKQSFQCSSSDERVAKMCVNAVLATRQPMDYAA